MGRLLTEHQATQIRKLNKEFSKKFPNWMCEGSEDANGNPCNAIFNNDTDEFFMASYDGKVIGNPNITSVGTAEIIKMADIQGRIRRIANG